jgi:hypothetical protein
MRFEGKPRREVKRRALMASIVLAGKDAERPQAVRFADRTTLRDDTTGHVAKAAPQSFSFPYYHWWFNKEARRIAGRELVADMPEADPRKMHHEDPTTRLLLAQESAMAWLRDCLPSLEPLADDADDRLCGLLAVCSPEQRRILRRALADNVVPIEAATRLGMSLNTAKKQSARISRKARSVIGNR